LQQEAERQSALPIDDLAGPGGDRLGRGPLAVGPPREIRPADPLQLHQPSCEHEGDDGQEGDDGAGAWVAKVGGEW
jgi:hypothetical protein